MQLNLHCLFFPDTGGRVLRGACRHAPGGLLHYHLTIPAWPGKAECSTGLCSLKVSRLKDSVVFESQRVATKIYFCADVRSSTT